jgi:hypothetical protein
MTYLRRADLLGRLDLRDVRLQDQLAQPVLRVRVVTFPARPFTIHGERRHFALIRAIDDPNAQDRLRELVLQAYLAEVEPAEKVGTP